MAGQSSNFRFLAKHDPQLDRLGALAERFFAEDANTSIIKMRQWCEVLAQLTAARIGLWVSPEESQSDLLRRLRDRGVLSREVGDLFHSIRKAGNQAAHDIAGDHRVALSCLKNARTLGIWFHRSFGGDPAFSPGPFVPPADPREESDALRAELAHLRHALAEQQSAQEQIAAEGRAEAERRLTAEESAQRADAERREWEALAQQIEADRARLQEQLAALQSAAESQPAEAVQEVIHFAQELGHTLDIDERETRRLIDERLRAAGWEVDSETMTYAAGVRPQKGRAMAIAEWPTANGPADYVLFVDGAPLAVVEAKRRNRNVSQVIDQAQRYAAGLAPGITLVAGGPWGEFKVPFAFSSNGRPFLRQIPELTGIWFRDLRRPTNLRRPLEDWYTPGGLKQLLDQDIGAAQEALLREPFAYNFGLRDYQEQAIRSIEQAIAAGQDHILVAMATGTGKTKTCVALIYRLLKANRFRRVLFLVDRTALGDQAAGAFKTTKMEQQKDFADIYEVRELGDLTVDAATRVHIATVQALVKRVLFPEDGPPPIDQYDCIVVDECHRGYLLDREMGDDELRFRDQRDYISKYRRVLDRFDAVRIGLTATPALHTREIFGPPVFQYTYREAVIDGWLVDHDPPRRLHTRLSDEGIAWQPGDPLEMLDVRSGEVDLVEAPDRLAFEVDGFNSKVVTPEFNRVVCEWLAEEIDPALPGKTLIFCASDLHCDIVVEKLKQAFAARHGAVTDAAVQKITGKADRPNEKIRHFKNEDLPKVAVTVELLTTGIDVPQITNLVFIRRVNSRILYEQMIGRATRLCPEIGKETFRILDAVGLYDAMQAVSQMQPVAANPSVTFAKLADDLFELLGLKQAEPDEEGAAASGLSESEREPFDAGPASPEQARHRAEGTKYLVEQFLAKLQRKRKRMGPEARAAFAERSGMDIDDLARRLRDDPPEQAARLLAANRRIITLLDDFTAGRPWVLPISDHADKHRRVTTGYGDGKQRPEDYLDAFASFVRTNINKLPALMVIAQRPRELTRAQLREVRLMLAEAGFEEASLRAAWRAARAEDIAASILGYIRQAALGDPLEPYDIRVRRAMNRILARPEWSEPQRQWLRRIGQQLERNVVVDRASLDQPPFDAQGGFGRLNKVFGGKLETVLGEIAEAVWDKAG